MDCKVWMLEEDAEGQGCCLHSVNLEIENESPEELDRAVKMSEEYLNDLVVQLDAESEGDNVLAGTSFKFENSPGCGIMSDSGVWNKDSQGNWILAEEW